MFIQRKKQWGKKGIDISKDEQQPFTKLKSYSIDEVLATGGADAFAEKMGKSWQNLIATLKKIPKEDFLTEEEFEQAMKTLKESK